MEKKKFKLTLLRMAMMAKYQITLKDIIAEGTMDDFEWICPEKYTFTLDDLYHAILKIKEKDPSVGEFGKYWFDPINMLSDAFNLSRACGHDEDSDDTVEYQKKYPGLYLSDSDFFSVLWEELASIRDAYDDEERLSDVLFLDVIINDFIRYFGNRDKPIEERVFSTNEIKSFIGAFENDDFVKEASEQQLALARKYIDELCKQDDGLALRIKGYACYGGNRLYPCDWDTSRECMHRLFDKEDNPLYANTLGYIYYYGRCNGGVPEYDKAFYYFGIAAANGIYEGMYKLADMFCHGYGCRKSTGTARSLYGIVYDDSYKRFLQGENTNFADAALRMGNVYAKGINEEVDIQTAYYYYLQAVYAARIRAEADDFFGNVIVYNNAWRAEKETRKQLPEGFLQMYLDYQVPVLFEVLAADNNKCLLTKLSDADNRMKLIAKRISTQSVPCPEKILVTISQLSFCSLTNSVAYSVPNNTEIWIRDDKDSVRFDYCEWNYDEERYEFYYDEELVSWVKAGRYRFSR